MGQMGSDWYNHWEESLIKMQMIKLQYIHERNYSWSTATSSEPLIQIKVTNFVLDMSNQTCNRI